MIDRTRAEVIRDKPTPPPIGGVVLTLTTRDAEALLGLVGRVGGPYEGTQRESYSNIFTALHGAGITPKYPTFDRTCCYETSVYVKS